jgi:sulfate adenylyltransferase subunit 1 (EFTu-like GTPase family)
MANVFISVSNSIDIDVKSGDFVVTKNEQNEAVKMLKTPSIVFADGAIQGSLISIKTAMPFVDEVAETVYSVLDYHGVEALMDGTTINIEDAEFLEEDTIEALETAVKGLNNYLK